MKNTTYREKVFAEQADQTIIIKKPMTTPPIIEWLKQHPLLSLNRLSAAAGIKSTAIYKYMDGTRTMRQEHEKALCEILSTYGYANTMDQLVDRPDFYPYKNPVLSERTRSRLLRLQELGLSEVGTAQFGIKNVMSGLYIEMVWDFNDERWADYIEFIIELKDKKEIKQQPK